MSEPAAVLEAKAALGEAIERYIGTVAHAHVSSDSLIPGEWVLVASLHGVDSDGDEISTVTVLPHGATHRVSGLLDNALTRLRAWVSQPDRDGDGL